MFSLLKYVKQYKLDASITPFFIVLEVIMEINIPLTMAKLIDRGITQGNMDQILHYSGILFGMALIALMAGILAGRYSASAAAGFGRNLRLAQFQQLQTFAFNQIDKFTTASLITRITTDANNVQGAFQTIIGMAVRTPVMIILAIVAVFSINPKLSFIILLFMPIIVGGMAIIVTIVHPIYGKIMRQNDQLNMRVQENIKGIRVVKSFVQEDQERNKMKAVIDDLQEKTIKAESVGAFFGPITQFSMYAATLLVAWFGAKLVVQESLSTGELMGFFAYMSQILHNMMMFVFVFMQLMFSRASIRRIREVLESQSSIVSPENAKQEVANGNIVFENVSFAYDLYPQERSKQNKPKKRGKKEPSEPQEVHQKEVLHEINITIASGSTVGILGSTGSGKSSLVQLIPRLYDVTSGRILVGDHDVRSYDLDTLRNAVAMVLQKNELFSGTIANNLRWGDQEANQAHLEMAAMLAQAHPFIDRLELGYESILEQGASNLSGGQRQRLSIARALLKRPKILILDDSTSAVDTKTDMLIRRELNRHQKDVTKIIIAQRVASVMHSDLILVIESGRIIASGQHEELLEHCSIYQELYASQNKKERLADE